MIGFEWKKTHQLSGKEKVPVASASKEGHTESFLGPGIDNFLERVATIKSLVCMILVCVCVCVCVCVLFVYVSFLCICMFAYVKRIYLSIYLSIYIC